MFASLKNKIREETGSDLSKITAKLASSTAQRIESIRGRTSHTGSTSSLNSIVSSDGLKEEGSSPGQVRTEQELSKMLEAREVYWKEIIVEKDRQLSVLSREKEEAVKKCNQMRESLKNAEDFKQKVLNHQENNDQIENLQSQELSKVKRLVLLREQELEEKAVALKEANLQLEKLRSEVSRLRRQEEQLNDVQDDLEALRHSTARDLATLGVDLAKSEEERRHLSDLVVILRERVANETSGEEHVIKERLLLEQRLEEAHLHLSDIKTSWSDKISSLETQVGRLSRQAAEEGTERRRAVQEKDNLIERVKQLEAELDCNRFELNNKETKISRLTADVNELSFEVKSLRLQAEEEVAFLRTELDNKQTELKVVRKNLENTESELDKSENERSQLQISVDSEHQANGSLRLIITKLEKELGEEKTNSLNVQRTLTRVTSEKNTALLRNAEISQQMELVKQEMRRQELEMQEMLNKISKLEDNNEKFKESKKQEVQLQNNIVDLEDQISEKNKHIKTLQLRLADMKKTLQQELRTPGNINYNSDLLDNSVAVLTASQTHKSFPSNVKRDEDDVNFKYLKHVVIKFLTSREYEAQHLIKAISTLLKFTNEEEKLIQDTLEWKKSWFGGTKPRLPQTRLSSS